MNSVLSVSYRSMGFSERPAKYIPAGVLCSKQNSIEMEEQQSRQGSEGEAGKDEKGGETGTCAEESRENEGNIIVFDNYTPREEVCDAGKTVEVTKHFQFPEDQFSCESMTSIRQLMIQIDEKSQSTSSPNSQLFLDPGDSFQVSQSRASQLPDSLCSHLSSLCTPCCPSDLKHEIDALKAHCALYESQNQELRHEIHLSTNDILTLDRGKKEAVAEIQRLRGQLSTVSKEVQAAERAMERIKRVMEGETGVKETAGAGSDRWEGICRDVEAMVGKVGRLRALNESTAAENKRLIDLPCKLSESEQAVASLRQVLQQRDKQVSILEEQLCHLRAPPSAQSSQPHTTRSSTETFIPKSASASFRKPALIQKTAKGKESPLECSRFSAYLLDDGTENPDAALTTHRDHSQAETGNRLLANSRSQVFRKEERSGSRNSSQGKAPRYIWKTGEVPQITASRPSSGGVRRSGQAGSVRKFVVLE